MASKPDPRKIAMIELEKKLSRDGFVAIPEGCRMEFLQPPPAARERNCRNCGAPPTRAGYCLYCGTETAFGRFNATSLMWTPTPGERQTF